MPRRPGWPLFIAAVLLLLLAALAMLQYRWIGQVSDAERDRLHADVRARASAFADDFDRALAQVYVAFQASSTRFDEHEAQRFLSSALAAAQASGADVVRDVYFFDPTNAHRLSRLDAVHGTLEPAEWPASLDRLQQRIEGVVPAGGGPPIFFGDVIDAETPAFIVPLPRVERIRRGEQIAVLPVPLASIRTVVVVLDAGRIRQHLIEPLVAKHFGDPASSEYFVTIVRGDDPTRIVYSSSPESVVDARTADVTAGIFNLRLNDVHAFPPPDDGGGTPEDAKGPATIAKYAITIVRRATGGDGSRMLMAGSGGGEWRLMVRGRNGSLEALVSASRRRNVAISLGVLGLLAASVVLSLGSAQRQRRLARQQMEFVAAVSHELRTPLAVICAAGENLADGVIADRRQVKQYGALVQTEGRRLADMVERVMEFAGIASGTMRAAHAAVDVAQVVDAAVDGVSADARERGVAIEVRHAARPTIAGDADGLRSAVQNLVGNAVKYSATGSVVEVAVGVDASAVSIRVADRGIGIDARDLPHVFKPFFRGRRAVDAQIRGSGVGLSVVRHVVDGHHGRVHVESSPGGGTTVTMELPVAATGGGARAPEGVAP